jgi:HAD superfamily hydrolase (TIGR01509 family)
VIRAIVFDMDGVLVDSEPLWHEVRRDLAAAHGGRWGEEDQRAVMGDNSRQWASYLRRRFGVPGDDEEIIARVVFELLRRYDESLPLLPGAAETVRGLAARWPLGLASSSPRRVIDHVLEHAGLAGCFAARVSSDEVRRGKPEPDVYLEACRRLGVAPAETLAVEDSTNGLKSAAAAGMRVVAAPGPAFAPDAGALAVADAVLTRLTELDVAFVEGLR